MITVPELAATALSRSLTSFMKRRFGSTHADLAELIPSLARLALECIGKEPQGLYDGSWSEWGSRPDLPVERG